MENAQNVAQVLQGLALAREIVERTGVRDPDALRRAAEQVERLASSDLERAVAAGFRAIAAEGRR